MLIGHYEMLAMTLNALQVEAPMSATLAGRRVLITGAARGIGALTARRLHERGARVALLGLEPELLEQVAADCGGAPWFECDVADREQVDDAVADAVERLGGLDVAIANAGIGAQMPLVGGDPAVWDAHDRGQPERHVQPDPRRRPARQPSAAATSSSPRRSPPRCTCR